MRPRMALDEFLIILTGTLYVFGGVSGQLQPFYRNDVWRRDLVGDCDFESSPTVRATDFFLARLFTIERH